MMHSKKKIKKNAKAVITENKMGLTVSDVKFHSFKKEDSCQYFLCFVSWLGIQIAYYSSKLCFSTVLITIPSFSIPERQINKKESEIKPRPMLCSLMRDACIYRNPA